MKYAVLEALRRRDEPASAAALAEELALDEAEVRRAVEALRVEGYCIEAQPPAELRLAGRQDRLIPYEIRHTLATRVIGSAVQVLESAASTNDVAWNEALAGAPEGTVIFAEEQTAGRGRMGRHWHSPRGANLLLSVILRPTLEANQSNLLTVVSSVAVAQALRENLHVQARIRWPNDITIKGRKVAGILVEGRTLATGAVFVMGIGLNVNMTAEQIPPDLRDIATSLSIELGQPAGRVETARVLLQSLDRWYRDLSFGDYGRIARCWRRLSSTMGERVTLIENGREFRGRVLDLSLEEGLIVRLDEGVTRIFHPSTVTMRPPQEDGTSLHPAR